MSIQNQKGITGFLLHKEGKDNVKVNSNNITCCTGTVVIKYSSPKGKEISQQYSLETFMDFIRDYEKPPVRNKRVEYNNRK